MKILLTGVIPLIFVILIYNLHVTHLNAVQISKDSSSAIYVDINTHSVVRRYQSKFVKPHKKNVTYEDVPLYKYLNTEYYGIVGLGKPSKEFKFKFDTTWADIMVASSRCDLTQIACLIHNRYDRTKSSTYQQVDTPINLTSSEFTVEGLLSRDDFHLGHIQLVNQSFTEAMKMSINPFLYSKSDGIIGLGFENQAVSDQKPFFYNLMDQYKSLNNISIFTIYMNRDATTERSGRLILGGTERKHIRNPLKTLPTLGNKDFWKVRMDRLTLDLHNKSIPFGINSEAFFDTGRQSIMGPPNEIAKINSYLNAVNIGFGNYMVNCREYAKLPSITMTLNGNDFQIESKYYVQKMTLQGLEMCLSPFKPVANEGSDWFLGGAFLMQFYTEYDILKATVSIGKTIF